MGEDDERPESLPDDSNPLHFETEYAGRPPSIAIVEAIAAIEDVTPTDVEFTLYEQLDPEALDTLFDEQNDPEETEADVVAEFHIDDYTVQVTADGQLTVTMPEAD